MLIVLEGPDLVGKTHLAERLARHLQDLGRTSTVLHAHPPDPPERDPFYEYEGDLSLSLKRGDVICDRWHIGELIYGPLLRQRSRLDDAGLLHVNLFLESLGAVTVQVELDEFTHRRRYDELGDQHVTWSQLVEVTAAYEHYFKQFPPTIKCQSDAMGAVEVIIEMAESEEPKHSIDLTPTYIGDLDPLLLLVGDRTNEKWPHDPGTHAAFVPYKGTSGHFLLTTLAPLYPQNRLAIVNVNEDAASNELLVLMLNSPVVALGEHASRTLRTLGVDHGIVPHPQYVRRFHHHRTMDYGAAILDAAHGRDRRCVFNYTTGY